MNDDNKEPILDDGVDQEEVVTPKNGQSEIKSSFATAIQYCFISFG